MPNHVLAGQSGARRPEGYVAEGEPVTADELRATAAVAGVALEAGDALLIHCGRDNCSLGLQPYAGPEITSRRGASMYRYTEAGALRRMVRQATTSRPLAWLSARILPNIDRVAYRSTRGRFTFSRWMSGLPVVMLTTTGARTGQPRTTPVLGIPAGDGLVVVAANFGQTRDPSWYHNLRAHPRVSVTAGGVEREYDAHELAGEERDRQFQEAVRMNPGWLRYRTWAGDRQIPVIRLDRVTSESEDR